MVTAIFVPNTQKSGDTSMISEARSNDTDSDMEIGNANDRAKGESIAALPTWDAARASIQARKKRKRPTAMLLKSAMEDLDKIWETPGGEGGRACEAEPILPLDVMRKVQQTTDLLVKVFTQDIHEPAIQALATNEELKASKLKLQSELDTKSKEVERLRRSEQRSKEAIQNLLKAVTESAEATKDESQTKLLEAKMRADLLHAISERDASQKDCWIAQRSVDLLRGDVENLKTERTKLQHDKLRLEREVRSARALADQLSNSLLGSDSHHRDDLDYYKGKSKELEIHLQGMTARLAEKNQEIQELRRYNNRNLSQQKLESLRESGMESATAKKPRKSY